MSKLKSPFLSLGAQGTIGNSLTFQKRYGDTLVREKPVPKDPYTLAQAYHRWLYQDYAYLWTLETEASKQAYRTRASRYHITGFNLWMREHLRDLPDIAGMWHLDHISNGLTPDTSKNNNPGTVIGAYPVPGVIDHGFYFDGLNDTVNLHNPPELDLTSALSVEFFAATRSLAVRQDLLYSWGGGYTALFNPFAGNLRLQWALSGTAPLWLTGIKNDFVINQIYHFYFGYDKDAGPNNRQVWVGGLLDNQDTATGPCDNSARARLNLGGQIFWLPGFVDHLVIRNRTLDPTEILRHSERRYPVQ